jgi:S1-C subfamily serine protease
MYRGILRVAQKGRFVFMSRPLLLLSALLALILAACGGGSDDTDQVSDAQATARAIVESANATARSVNLSARRQAPTVQPTIPPAPAPTVTQVPRATETPTPIPPTSTPAPTATSAPTAVPTAVAGRDVADLQQATVQITVEGDGGLQITGSGSIISANGLILTNAHVVYDSEAEAYYDAEGGATISVTTDPRQPAEPRYTARVVQIDPEADVAVLKVTARIDGRAMGRGFKLSPIFALADSDSVAIGDPLRVFGFPGVGGDSVTLTRGVVSGFLPFEGLSLIKTDAQFTHGSSGGAAVNDAGELIGIPSAGVVDDAGRVGYVVPVDAARPLIRKAAAGQAIALRPDPTPTPEETAETVTLYVDAADQGYTGANVRARPSLNADLLDTLDNGESVEAYPGTVTGDNGKPWYKVPYEGRTAYILGSLLSTSPPGETPAEPEEPAMPPGAGGQGEVVILSDRAYTDDIDYTHVVGEVRNNTNTPVEFVEITATFYNKAGKVIATDYTYAALEIVPSGGKSPFEILKELPTSAARYTLNVDWEEADTAPPSGLKILSRSQYVDDIDFLHIVGEVKNTSGRRLEYVEIVATFYDKRGRVLATDFTYTSPESLRGGQTAPFEFVLEEGNLANARVVLQVQGNVP